MSELLQCPFCGGEPDEYEGEYGNGIYCMECGAMVGEPIHLGFNIAERVSYEQAVEAWNTRADDYRQAAEYWQRMYEEAFAERTCRMELTDLSSGSAYHDVWLCCACGEQVEQHTAMGKSEQPNYCPNCGAKVVDE